MTTTTSRFTAEEARSIGESIGIDWATSPFPVEEFRMGLDVELEHGAHDPETNVTGDDPILTGKIAWAHLKELLRLLHATDRDGGRGGGARARAREDGATTSTRPCAGSARSRTGRRRFRPTRRGDPSRVRRRRRPLADDEPVAGVEAAAAEAEVGCVLEDPRDVRAYVVTLDALAGGVVLEDHPRRVEARGSLPRRGRSTLRCSARSRSRARLPSPGHPRSRVSQPRNRNDTLTNVDE